MLRCKFRLDRVVKEQNNCRQLTMTASNQKEGDNKDWSQWTPSGELKFIVTNPSALSQIDAMNPGDHFWIDIKPVTAE